MAATETIDWLLGVLLSSGIIAGAAYLSRDFISRVLTRSVEHRFDKQLEEFKSDIRKSEQEVDQIRSFLSETQKGRNSLLQQKKLEAAEELLRARNILSQMTLLVEYMKTLNSEYILKNSSDPKITEFIELLLKPVKVDEKIQKLSELNMTLPKLYLSERTLKVFDAYEGIILQAVLMMKVFSVPLAKKENLLKDGTLIKKIMEVATTSKEGFEQWGEDYAYHWLNYFYDEVLKSLRAEISGFEGMARDLETAEHLFLGSRRASLNIQASLEATGLPDSVLQVPRT